MCQPAWVCRKRAQLSFRLAEAVNRGDMFVEEAIASLSKFDDDHKDSRKKDSVRPKK